MVKFVQARNYTVASRGAGAIRGVVVHCMEAPEGPATAENVAGWFAGQPANGTKDPATGTSFAGTSAHWNVDADSVVQSVLEKDVAWHAGPVNGWTVGVEHAGYARQSPEEWADAYSIATLERSAELVAGVCARWGIPVRRLTAQQLAAGERDGIFGHVDVTLGLTAGRGHTDPGAHFPWDWWIERVRSHVPAPPAVPLVVDAAEAAAQIDQGAPVPLDDFVPVEHAGQTWLVSPTYYGPVGIGEAQRLARAIGCELPTPGLVDSIWRQADLVVSPARTIQAHDGTAAGMNSPEVYARVAAGIAEAVADRGLGIEYRLLAGAFKDVVFDGGKLGIYGWHVADEAAFEARLRARLGASVPLHAPATPGPGRVVQPAFYGHSETWKDYSQAFRPVRLA